MPKISGIGGFFFRARDPEALARWYSEHFGIDPAPGDYAVMPWVQEGGPTVFAPFRDDTEYFGDEQRAWMLNFRVSDLDAMVAALRAADITVAVDPETYPNGRFARVADPEGNPIELWEPRGAEARL
jgi:predicted enzyme related to lactoylglutathione lyase